MCSFAMLVYYGVIRFNNPSEIEYPVKGVDVSSYQGDIDWKVLASQNIDFAFIKATEGSGFVDPMFETNYSEATKTNLRVGAYHFFSYDSSGLTQAENFISTVPKSEDMLPPVIDVEFYGDKANNLPDKEETQKNLSLMIEKLEEYYGKKPIIYATGKAYNLYIADSYKDYDIWVRNVFINAGLSDGREWAFWQYTDKAKLDGYNGKEKYIDMNVFNGTEEEFENYGNSYTENDYSSSKN